MAGHDPQDQTSSEEPVESYSDFAKSGQPKTIGYIAEALESPGLDPEVKAIAEASLERLRAQGHIVKEVHVPLLEYLVPCYYILTTAEASSNLSRYDGVHYGYRSKHAATLDELYTNSRQEGFGKEVQKRILLGTFVLSAGYADAYYHKAMKVRRLIRSQVLELFQECDVLFSPTAPTPAYALGTAAKDPIGHVSG